jgi:hypothetical protein
VVGKGRQGGAIADMSGLRYAIDDAGQHDEPACLGSAPSVPLPYTK